MLHLTIDKAFLILAILTGFATIGYARNVFMKSFPFFLLITLTVEFAAQQFRKPGVGNAFLYNFYVLFAFAVYGWHFYSAAITAYAKRIAAWATVLMPLACLFNILLGQGLNTFNTYTFVPNTIVIILLGVVYFYTLYNSKQTIDIWRTPSFWISAGVVFFYLCSISALGAANQMTHLPPSLLKNMKNILFIVNCVLYSAFIIGFLCQINIRRSSSSS